MEFSLSVLERMLVHVIMVITISVKGSSTLVKPGTSLAVLRVIIL